MSRRHNNPYDPATNSFFNLNLIGSGLGLAHSILLVLFSFVLGLVGLNLPNEQ